MFMLISMLFVASLNGFSNSKIVRDLKSINWRRWKEREKKEGNLTNQERKKLCVYIQMLIVECKTRKVSTVAAIQHIIIFVQHRFHNNWTKPAQQALANLFDYSSQARSSFLACVSIALCCCCLLAVFYSCSAVVAPPLKLLFCLSELADVCAEREKQNKNIWVTKNLT